MEQVAGIVEVALKAYGLFLAVAIPAFGLFAMGVEAYFEIKNANSKGDRE